MMFFLCFGFRAKQCIVISENVLSGQCQIWWIRRRAFWNSSHIFQYLETSKTAFFESLIFFKKSGTQKMTFFFAMFQILSKAMYTDVRKPFVRYMSTLMDQKACFLGRVTYLSIFGDLQKLCFSSLWCSSIFIVFNHVHFADLLRRRGGSRCTCWRSVARLHGSQLAWMSADQAGPWNCAA